MRRSDVLERHQRRVASPAMFDTLSDRFDGIFSRLRSRGRLNEKDVDEVAREIRLALLEGGVNVKVVEGFIARGEGRGGGGGGEGRPGGGEGGAQGRGG